MADPASWLIPATTFGAVVLAQYVTRRGQRETTKQVLAAQHIEQKRRENEHELAERKQELEERRAAFERQSEEYKRLESYTKTVEADRARLQHEHDEVIEEKDILIGRLRHRVDSQIIENFELRQENRRLRGESYLPPLEPPPT